MIKADSFNFIQPNYRKVETHKRPSEFSNLDIAKEIERQKQCAEFMIAKEGWIG